MAEVSAVAIADAVMVALLLDALLAGFGPEPALVPRLALALPPVGALLSAPAAASVAAAVLASSVSSAMWVFLKF